MFGTGASLSPGGRGGDALSSMPDEARVTVTRHPSRDVMSSASFWTASQSFSTWLEDVKERAEEGAEDVGAVVTFGRGTGGKVVEGGNGREVGSGEVAERAWGEDRGRVKEVV